MDMIYKFKKMKSKTKRIAFIEIAAVILVLAIAYMIISFVGGSKSSYNAHKLIWIYNEDNDNDIMEMGIEQAALDMRVDVLKVPYNNKMIVGTLIDLIQSEVEDGIGGLLIEMPKDENIVSMVEELGKDIPIVSLKGYDDSNKTISSGVNKSEFGRSFGKSIASTKLSGGTVLILSKETGYSDNDDIVNAMANELSILGIECTNMNLNGSETSPSWNRLLSDDKYSALVVINPDNLRAIASIKKEQGIGSDKALFGIGNTNEIISYLEDGYIDGIGVESDFSTGYMGVSLLYQKIINEKATSFESSYRIIYSEEVYTSENQRFLFPFIQ